MLVDLALPITRKSPMDTATDVVDCVYCGEAFSLDAPYVGKGCRIRHFGMLNDERYRVEYECCDAKCEHSGYRPDYLGPLENELGKYCWQGRHRAVHLRRKDFDKGDSNYIEANGLDEEYYVEGFGSVDLSEALWWQNWDRLMLKKL